MIWRLTWRNPNREAFNARRFAALMAGFDTGNVFLEEEAVSKGRALRKMAAEANLRIVDALELPDVKKAIDEQMQPVRQESHALQTAMEQAAALREELTARTRDVRRMAELLAKARSGQKVSPAPSSDGSGAAHSFGSQSWVFEAGAVLLALLLMGMAALSIKVFQKGRLCELGNHQGTRENKWYGMVGQFLLFQNIVFYLLLLR